MRSRPSTIVHHRVLARTSLPPRNPAILVAVVVGLMVLAELASAPPARAQEAPATPAPADPATATATPSGPGGGLRASIGRQGFVTTWLMLGPFPYAQPQWGIDVDFLSEVGGETKVQPVKGGQVAVKPQGGDAPASESAKVAWTPIASDRRYVDLNTRMKPNDYVVAYVAVYLVASRTQELFFKFGSDDGARAWLNGEMIYDHPKPRDAIVDDDAVRVKVKSGPNLLLLKVEERRGQWGFYCRILDDLRRPPPGVSLLLPGSNFQKIPLFTGTLATQIPREVYPDGVLLKPEVKAEFGYTHVDGLYARASVRAANAKNALSVSGVQGTSSSILGRGRTSFTLPLRNVPDGEYIVRVEVGQRGMPPAFIDDTRVVMRKAVYTKWHQAKLTLAQVAKPGPTTSATRRSAIESATYVLEALEALLVEGDRDVDYLESEADRAVRLAAVLAIGQDPFVKERGAFLRAYRSPFDGALQKYAVYVPKSYDPNKRYPLVVALHGLGGEVMMALRVALGIDQREGEPYVKALRYLPPLPEVEALIVAPYGYGDIAYRGIGTDDVLRVIDEVKRNYNIDADRVALTGWSMGGIGVFEVGMRHADRFSALVALCGYSDVGLYSSAYTRRRPFERDLFEGERAVNYAENGRNVPLTIIHGTNDSPNNSLVFADRYTKLGYNLSVEVIEAGHNVWGYAFENQTLLRKLIGMRRNRMPREVTFKAFGYRHRSLYWVSIGEIPDLGRFARVDAKAAGPNTLEVKTENVDKLTLTPAAPLVDPLQAVKLKLDGKSFSLPWQARLHFVKKAGDWSADQAAASTVQLTATSTAAAGGVEFPPTKVPDVSGPMLDNIYNRTMVVYGTQPREGIERDSLKRVADELAAYRRGARLKLPMKADADVTTDNLQNYHLWLVGGPSQNLITSRIADRLPIRIGKRDITVGKKTYRGGDIGVAFVYPNPTVPQKTVTVFAATGLGALFDALHLPRMLPDYVVWNRKLSKDIGGFFLGKERDFLEAGFFDRRWHTPDRPYRGNPRYTTN